MHFRKFLFWLFQANFPYSLLLLFLFFSTNASSQNLFWAGTFSGTAFKNVTGMGIDTLGNIYSTGVFEGVVDFDAGSGVYNLTAASGDIFITKSASNGNFLWVKQIGSSGFDRASAMYCDSSGNMYITGGYTGTVDFDPGIGVVNLTSTTDGLSFILKLDSAGNFFWVKTFNTGSIKFTCINADRFGNPVFFAEVGGTFDCDPGSGIFNITSAGLADAVMLKLSAAGNFMWAKQLSGVSYASATVLKIANNGDIGISGYYSETMDLDPGPGDSLVSTPGQALTYTYAARYDSAGNFIWGWQLSATDICYIFDIAFDSHDNMVVTGTIEEPADLDPGPGEYRAYDPAAMGDDLFVSKFDVNGNFLWAYTLATVNNEEGLKITVDSTDNIILAASFYDSVDFDPGPDTLILGSGSTNNFALAICKLAPGGNILSARQIAGTGYIIPEAMLQDKHDVLYMGGQLRNTVDFNPGPGQYLLQSLTTGKDDIFIAKLTSSTKRYIFSGNGNWDDPLNWQGGFIPPSIVPSGTEIIINTSSGNQCFLNVAVTVLQGASITVTPGSVFVINGNLTILK